MTQLTPGDIAPAFTLPDADGKPVSLSDYAGGRVIVYFFPAALTPGCSLEAVDFDAAMADLAAAGYQVVGVSPDSTAKLATFRERDHLRFPLLADPARDVLGAYGAFGTKMLYGKQVEGVIRSTFIVDVDAAGAGVVKVAQYNVRATGHVAKLRRELGV
ncbi:peroxiredoxin [Propionicimonas sp.]|uniref:peroxiredoxin n=1 Tax=Propionicimonas sp. TaxID=1955623 RepID=UPI0039E66707